MRRPSDRTLARRSRGGDREAFIELIRRHEEPLAALIRRQVGDPHHAEDVLQVTLLQAWLGLRHIRDPRKVRAWLLQIARNRCRDFFRSAQRRMETADEEALEIHLDRYGRSVARNESARAEVFDAFDKIPAAERRAARLFYRSGLTIAEIAARTHAEKGTVKRRLFDAREHLRRALGVGRKRKEN